MGHSITAILLKNEYDKTLAEEFDLFGISLEFNLTLFHIDHYYAAYWQAKLGTSGYLELATIKNRLFPSEMVLADLMCKISKCERPEYAILVTHYFGGVGDQCANVFCGKQLASKTVSTINQALSYLGVLAKENLDEFDTLGLDKIRSQPVYLGKYIDLADELGV